MFRGAATFVAACLLVLAGLVPGGTVARAVSPDLVISQVYGGGGNAGAPLTHDFIEIFNRGSAPVLLAGLSLQYASATGTGAFGATTAQLTELPATFLAPGQYFLVQESSAAAVGAALPAPDAVDATPIALSATAGKVALVSGTTSLGCNGGSLPCSAAQLALIVDLVGYGGANLFEGAGAAPTLSNTTAAFRAASGCTDTDSNAADFAAAAPAPRNTSTPLNFCAGDAAPSVTSHSPANGAVGVAVGTNITITFSEPVVTVGSWYTISCTASGTVAANSSGGASSFVIDPVSDLAAGETCTVTVLASAVSDQDVIDPPDAMAADRAFSFTTEAAAIRIREIQGAGHLSPLSGTTVTTTGIVTAKRSNGYFIQDAAPDADDATSEGIFVFTSSAPGVTVGDGVRVAGRVTEFRPGGASSGNLTTTQLTGPATTIVSSGNPLPAAVVIGTDRTPPSVVIEDDATGSVETSGVFDPASDGIDFWESLEGMRLRLDDAEAVGPTNGFGEVAVVVSGGTRTPRGGIVITETDLNPERLLLDDAIMSLPAVDTGDRLSGATVGVLDYSFGNFKLLVTAVGAVVDNGPAREVTAAASPTTLSTATFNVENLDALEAQAKFDRLAALILQNLRAPDLISLEEVQDNDGALNTAVVDATATLTRLRDAIVAAGGPTYEWRQIDPVDDQDGGEPGGNIRQVFFFRTDRGLSFVDRPGGTSTSSTTVTSGPSGPQLSASPGRLDPANTAFAASRKPLAGEFRFNGHGFFAVANHFNSKGGDQPLFGAAQPPVRSSEAQRHAQANVVASTVSDILGADPRARVLVLGDLNDFQFSETLDILEAAGLVGLIERLPLAEQYTYVFDGNSQVLDHVLASSAFADAAEIDVVHVNAEYADQASDHDPVVARFSLAVTPALVCEIVRSVVADAELADKLCHRLAKAEEARADGKATKELELFIQDVEKASGEELPAAVATELLRLVRLIAP